MLWRLIAAFAITATLAAPSAFACSLHGPIDATRISFADWVRDVDRILIARAVAIDPADAREDSDPSTIGKLSFRFQTIERLKGDAPTSFSLTGDEGSNEDYDWRSSRHVPVGEFWLAFGTEGSCYSFLNVVLGRDYLIFLSADGSLRYGRGRGFEALNGPHDEWLTAVRFLVANAGARYARRADVITFLRAFDLIALVTPTRCDAESYATFDIIPLWRGTELIDPTQPQALYTAEDSYDVCRPGDTRLILAMSRPVSSDDDAIVRLSTGNGQIDLSPLLARGDQGLGRGEYSLDAVIAPQVEITGRLQWNLEDLATALRESPTVQ